MQKKEESSWRRSDVLEAHPTKVVESPGRRTMVCAIRDRPTLVGLKCDNDRNIVITWFAKDSVVKYVFVWI